MSIETKWTKTNIDLERVDEENWKESTKDLPVNVRLLVLTQMLLKNVAILEGQIAVKKKKALEKINDYTN